MESSSEKYKYHLQLFEEKHSLFNKKKKSLRIAKENTKPSPVSIEPFCHESNNILPAYCKSAREDPPEPL